VIPAADKAAFAAGTNKITKSGGAAFVAVFAIE
jgi:hypothetical protein